MSEALLKAIIKLFAIVAKEDEVTQTERDQIEAFLNDNLNKKAVEGYLKQFDEYSDSIIINKDLEQEQKNIKDLCTQINLELSQKQKIVIILELMSIILADGEISPREDELVKSIGSAFNVSPEEIRLIKKFVIGQTPAELEDEHILIIGKEPVSTSNLSCYIIRPGISGFISIIHIDSSDSYFIKYLGDSDIYLNGVHFKKGKISVFAVGSTIRCDKISPVYFGDVIAQFMKTGDEPRITFEANNISYRFRNGKLGLRNINIKEESGKLIGLMGASGAGKSTLLNVLNSTDKPSEGTVLINGINIHTEKKKIEGVIGFVPQDDLLIEDLSVYENLYFAAKLCFTHLSKTELDNLVLKTLNNLGLMETRNLKVGSPLEKTISGGQRKRLNIGLELLREPSVLFVDEPTSGLSSRDSENIMDLLKELSLKGKLIFVVIHQPSSDIFKMFDKLIILDTGGYQIYYGNPVDSVVYFKSLINMINSEQGECHECGNVNPEQIFNIIETKVVNEYGNFTDERKVLPENWNQYFDENTQLPEIEPSHEYPPSSLNIPSRIKQTIIFATRDIKSKLSNKQYLLINLLEAPILAFVLAYIIKYHNTDNLTNVGYVFSKNINMPAYLFMSVIVALFMGLTVSAEEIIRDRKILKREEFLNLSRSSYLFSKISILFTLSAIQTFTFVLVGNFILEVNEMLFIYWLILFTTSCMANVLGLNISSAFNTAVTIYILIPILLIPQLILSGVVVKFDKLNPSLSNTGKVPIVGDVMASRWAFEAAMVAQFKDNPFESQFYFLDKRNAESDYKKIYYIPELESNLEYCYNNSKSTDPKVVQNMENSFELLRNEIQHEMVDLNLNQEKFPQLDSLNIGTFSPTVYSKTLEFLSTLRRFYSRQQKEADEQRDKIMVSLTNTAEKREEFQQMKNEYLNESISEIVKNSNEAQRIIKADNRLYQKIYPIYMTPKPTHMFDYRTEFYVPVKHFMGRYFDTVYFNIVVIWIMSVTLIITLYFDVFRKILDFLGNLFTSKKY